MVDRLGSTEESAEWLSGYRVGDGEDELAGDLRVMSFS